MGIATALITARYGAATCGATYRTPLEAGPATIRTTFVKALAAREREETPALDK